MSILRSFICTTVALLTHLSGLGCAGPDQWRRSEAAIHQVGLIWLKRAGNANDRRKVIEAIHEFARTIPDVQSASVGETDGIGGPYADTTFDLCFILTFRNEEARQRYGKHPVHEKAAKEVFLPLSEKLLFYRFIAR
jgi:hypothetical protein